MTDKIFDELGLRYEDRELVYENYAYYLIDKVISGKIQVVNVLEILNDIYLNRELEPPYSDFYSLYYAYDDLKYSKDQWYLDGVTRENIDKTIWEYFQKWQTKCR